jgi:hypothetical protein
VRVELKGAKIIDLLETFLSRGLFVLSIASSVKQSEAYSVVPSIGVYLYLFLLIE